MIGNNQDTKRRGSGNKSEHVLKEKKRHQETDIGLNDLVESQKQGQRKGPWIVLVDDAPWKPRGRKKLEK